MKNKKLIGLSMISIGILVLLAHAGMKLNANMKDWQHWGVLIATIIIIIGTVIRGMRK